jgi:hypothetical protein
MANAGTGKEKATLINTANRVLRQLPDVFKTKATAHNMRGCFCFPVIYLLNNTMGHG